MDTFYFILPEEYMPYAIAITGVLMVCFGLRALLKINRLSRHGIQTTGTLVRLVPRQIPLIRFSEDSDHTHHHSQQNRYTGIYSYTDEAGNKHELKHPAPDYGTIGKSSITVLYNPRSPNDAIAVDGAHPRLIPAIAAIVGFVAAVISLGNLLL